MDLSEQILLVERHHAEAFLAERGVPGAEVHQDRDVTWVVHAGQTWRNAAIMVRFSVRSAPRRLDTLSSRYERHGRGMAFWISPASSPANLPTLLAARRLRCQKYFPAMIRHLNVKIPQKPVRGVEIRPVVDMSGFESVPHPAIGPISTPLRRQAFERLATLISDPARRIRAFVAWQNDKPVGAVEMFVGKTGAGIHGLSVLPALRGQGIGSALVERACEEAARSDATTMVLLASTPGQRVYRSRGFVEVGRFGFWYRSFQRDC
jgi:ribosomal protein S18 acetylase RimI-like enzyme